jgi:hypothetical protein
LIFGISQTTANSFGTLSDMKISGVLSIAATFFTLSQAAPTASPGPVTYDQGYDDASRSLTVVSCSNGENGLITKYGWSTQGQIPRFPYIGGVAGITWNSPTCGTCWQLSYKGRSIYVLGIDAAYNGGFNIGLTAMNDLTNGAAVDVGTVSADSVQVPVSNCGL